MKTADYKTFFIAIHYNACEDMFLKLLAGFQAYNGFSIHFHILNCKLD